MNATKQQVDAIYFTALNLPDEVQRRAFLDRACTGDSQLCAAVEKLLSAHAATEEFFAGGSPSLSLTPEDFRDAFAGRIIEDCSAIDQKIGAQIGRYKLLQRIGEGGWGVVYMAEQEKPIRRRVAIKIIKLGMDTKSVIARFQTECQALAMMDHPGIARVLDAGATEAGRPYFVMELVGGVRVTEFCDQNHLAIRERLALFVQICQAVQHAHQKGIIHRDLKPSNILVALHDGVAAPKIIDFGIARAIEDRLTEKTPFTSRDQSVGTPAYMSPEQADASGLDVDTRSDIYGLGVLLYELLTGRTPFNPKELIQSGLEGMRRALREQEPSRPSTRFASLPAAEQGAIAGDRQIEASHLIALLKGDLDWVVMKALEKDRDRRYETANGMAMDLQRYLNNEPVIARPPSRLYRFQKLVRRNKVVFAAGISVAAALIIALAATTWLFISEGQARHEQARLRQEAETARTNEARLRKQAEVKEKLARIAALLSQTNYNEADALMSQAPLAEIMPSPESASVLRSIGTFYAVSGRWRQAADCFVALMRVNHFGPAETADFGMDSLYAGSALLECGDEAGYQRFRQDVLDRAATAAPSFFAEQRLKACMLAPAEEGVFERLKPLAKVLEQPLTRANARLGKETWDWATLALELMEFRRHHYSEAVGWGKRCLYSSDSNLARLAAGESVLAMSHFQLGEGGQALAELAQARNLVETQTAQSLQMRYSPQGSWCAWVIARQLEIEASALMADTSESGGEKAGVMQLR